MTASPFSIGSALWPGLSKLIEEAGEVLQVAGKLLGTGGKTDHWDGKGSLRDRLEDELADLQAAIEFVVEANHLDPKTFARRVRTKKELFWRWHHKQELTDG